MDSKSCYKMEKVLNTSEGAFCELGLKCFIALSCDTNRHPLILSFIKRHLNKYPTSPRYSDITLRNWNNCGSFTQGAYGLMEKKDIK